MAIIKHKEPTDIESYELLTASLSCEWHGQLAAEAPNLICISFGCKVAAVMHTASFVQHGFQVNTWQSISPCSGTQKKCGAENWC